MIDAAIEELIPVVDVRKACEVAGESQAGWFAGTAQALGCPGRSHPSPEGCLWRNETIDRHLGAQSVRRTGSSPVAETPKRRNSWTYHPPAAEPLLGRMPVRRPDVCLFADI